MVVQKCVSPYLTTSKALHPPHQIMKKALLRISEYEPVLNHPAHHVIRRGPFHLYPAHPHNATSQSINTRFIHQTNQFVPLYNDCHHLSCADGFSAEFGARELNRVIQRCIEMPLAGLLAARSDRSNCCMRCVVENGGIAVSFD